MRERKVSESLLAKFIIDGTFIRRSWNCLGKKLSNHKSSKDDLFRKGISFVHFLNHMTATWVFDLLQMIFWWCLNRHKIVERYLQLAHFKQIIHDAYGSWKQSHLLCWSFISLLRKAIPCLALEKVLFISRESYFRLKGWSRQSFPRTCQHSGTSLLSPFHTASNTAKKFPAGLILHHLPLQI